MNLLLYESYLESRYAPLYHWIKANYFFGALAEDRLLSTDTADIHDRRSDKDIYNTAFDQRFPTTLSFSRENTFTHTAMFRFTLNQELLRQNYKLVPYDAISYYMRSKYDKTKNFGKAQHKERIAPGTKNALDKWQVEYEEVIFDRNVTNLHKYVISIDVAAWLLPDLSEHDKQQIKDYVTKYPHIVINSVDTEKMWQPAQPLAL